MGDLLLKIYCDRSLRKIYSVVPKCTILLCSNHIATATTLVPSSLLTRRFSLEGVLCATSVGMSFLNIMSRITREGRLNEQLSLLHRPVSMSVQDSLKKSTEIKKTQPTVGNTTL